MSTKMKLNFKETVLMFSEKKTATASYNEHIYHAM